MWWRGASTSPDHCSLSRDTYWANSSPSFMSLARDAYPPVACNRLSQDMSREVGLFVDGLNQELEPQVERRVSVPSRRTARTRPPVSNGIPSRGAFAVRRRIPAAMQQSLAIQQIHTLP